MDEENKNIENNEEENIDGYDGDNNDSNNIDVTAMVDMLKEKDEQIEQLQKDVTELKKSNANLLVRVSAGEKHQEKSFEENLLGLVGEPTKRR